MKNVLPLCAAGFVTAVWTLAAVPNLEPLPSQRQTLKDLAKRLSHNGFLRPAAALAASTAALATGVGFLPVGLPRPPP